MGEPEQPPRDEPPSARPALRLVPPSTIDATGTWYSPGVALMLGALALAWQVANTYAEQLLPDKLERGAPLDRFDTLVDRIPLAGTPTGTLIGAALVLAAVALLAMGHRRGIRQPALQLTVGMFALAAIAAPAVLR